MHPSIKINQVIDDQEKFFSQSNIKLVEKRIEELFKEAKWVIYQRTTGVLNSINFNVRPLYCDNLEISLDPLGEIKIWKKVFRSKEQLQKILLKDITNSQIKKKTNLLKVKNMLNNYFFAMKKNQINKIIRK